MDQFGAELSNRLLFFNLWWKDLPKDAAERLLKVAGDYTYWLEQIRLFKPYTLTEAEEKILNIKNVTGFNALNTLYDSITNRYTFDLKGVRGGKGITRGELMVYVRESDPGCARPRIPGTLPGLYQGCAYPGADVPDPRAGLG